MTAAFSRDCRLPASRFPQAGRIVGSAVRDERAAVDGIGPITVDPAVQNVGVGRKLMQAVMDRAAQRRWNAPRAVGVSQPFAFAVYEAGVRPAGAAFVRPGRGPIQNGVAGCTVRQAQPADLETCNALSRRVHGFDRGVDLAQAIDRGVARVVERGGRITGYATELAFFGHATAETNPDLQALIASAESFGGAGILVPSRNGALLRWCLEHGLRIVQPMTLMSVGLYDDPAGAWLPSILF